MLEITHLSVDYGGLHALSDVSITVSKGEFVTVVGPNGAGKSTLFKAISGIVRPSGGEVVFKGESLLSQTPAKRAHKGIAHVPEGRRVFPSMSVGENLEMGAYSLRDKARRAELMERAFTLFPILANRREQLAGTLSGGEQQMLAIARGLVSDPDLLMLDEPSMGLAPTVADSIFERISELHQQDGLTIMLVEQRAAEALEHCNKAYVLRAGQILLSGTSEELLSNDDVRRAYLGT